MDNISANEKFIKRLTEKQGSKYTLISEFTNYKTKISTKCNQCNTEWEARPDTLMIGVCPGCASLKRKKTDSEFREEIKVVHGNNLDLISCYIDAITKVRMKCNSCNYEWMVLPNNLIGKKSGCPNCARETISEKLSLTHDEFVSQIVALFPNKYTLLSEYKSSKTKILIRCNIDGYEWMSLPGTLYKGMCPKCGNRVRRTDEMFRNEIYQKYGNEYTALSEFVTARNKILMKHNLCGHVYEVSPDKFLTQDRRCPQCYGIEQKTHNKFVNQVKEKYGERYSVISEYKQARTHVLVRCNRCKHEWSVTPDNLLRGFGCPACNVSKGEDKIKDELTKLGVSFKSQQTFSDLYGEFGKPLRFDFAIYLGDSLKCLIEFDGLFHFELGGFQTQEKFELQSSYDKKKNQYCKMNGIPLYRIPYWKDEKIPSIIEKIANEHVFPYRDAKI